MNGSLKEVAKKILKIAYKTNKELDLRGNEEIITDRTTDISLKADLEISKRVRSFLVSEKFPGILYTEELGKIQLSQNPKYVIVFDDIDGTKNKKDGFDLLPYCSILTIFNSPKPRYKDACLALVRTHTKDKTFMAIKNEGFYVDNLKKRTSNAIKLERNRGILVDHYASSVKMKKSLTVCKLYDKTWVKDIGSAGMAFALLASGEMDAYISLNQKAHELGAGYLFLQEAGGQIVDAITKKQLDDEIYDFNAKKEIVAASSSRLATIILNRIKEE